MVAPVLMLLSTAGVALAVASGLDVVLVSDLLPPAQVRFIPGDGHPTASTDAALARALARRYFPRPGTTD